MEFQLHEWLDRLAIEELIYRYFDAVMLADWQQCEALYCPDAIWESPLLGVRHNDRASIIEILRTTTEYDPIRQTPHAPVITFIGTDRARATTTILEFIRGVAVAGSNADASVNPNVQRYGIYYDDVALIDDEWKFTYRRFVPIYAGAGRVMGDRLTPRSELRRPGDA